MHDLHSSCFLFRFTGNAENQFIFNALTNTNFLASFRLPSYMKESILGFFLSRWIFIHGAGRGAFGVPVYALT